MKHLLLFLTAFLIFKGPSLSAQTDKTKYGRLTGYILYLKQQPQGSGFVRLSGATVTLVSGKDTLRMASVMDGKFSFKKVPAGESQITVTYVGKAPFSSKLTIEAGKEKFVTIQLEEKPFDIEGVVVQGSIPLFYQKGDTVMINSKVIKTMDGDRAVELLKQIPGITIEDSGRILAFGEPVVRTYLNKILFFGDDPKTPFKYFPAKEVAQMQVYDEDVTNIDIDGNFIRKKERVINIKSVTDVKNFTTGHFLLNYGKDVREDYNGNSRDRYRAGATINFFSEKAQAYVNAFTNNVNDNANQISNIKDSHPTSGYGNLKSLAAGYNRILKPGGVLERILLKTNYSYNDKYSKSESREALEYFPSENYSVRSSDKYSLTERTDKYHNFDLYVGNGNLNFTHTMSFSDNKNSFSSGSTNILDAESFLSAIESHTNQKSFTIKDVFTWSPSYNNNTKKIFIKFSSDISKDNGDRWRSDTLSSDLSRHVFQSSPIGKRMDLTASISNIDFLHTGKHLRWILGGDINYKYTRRKEIRFTMDEPSAPVMDNVNSFDYTYNYTSYKAGLESFNSKNLKLIPKIKIFFNSSRLNSDERVPEQSVYGKTFNSVTFSLSSGISFSKNNMPSVIYEKNKKFMYSYSTFVKLPSTEQLRQRIDDSNPMFLVAGNSDLKQEYTHNANISLTLSKIAFKLDASLTQNAIVQQQIFFTEETVLRAYNNYIAPKYSTLTTYRNANGFISSSLTSTYDGIINKIKSRFRLNCSGDYNRYLSYINDKENVTNNYRASLEMALTTNFSKSIRINLSSNSSYNYSRNSAKDSYRYFNQSANLFLEWNFLKKCYLNSLYNFSTNKRLGTNISYTTNICNIASGIRFFKNKLDIGFSVFDLFNKSADFRTVMLSNYIQNTWTPTFGQYWSLNVVFKFDALNRNSSGFAPNPG